MHPASRFSASFQDRLRLFRGFWDLPSNGAPNSNDFGNDFTVDSDGWRLRSGEGKKKFLIFFFTLFRCEESVVRQHTNLSVIKV